MQLGVSLKVNLITSAKFSKSRKKKLDFLRGNLNYITFDYLYPNLGVYWKRHLLRLTCLLMFSWCLHL